MPARQDLANAIRALSMDAVQRANSGHPGMPMGMADIAEVLWNDFLQHNPNNAKWMNRDRFILSNGHGSMLQYALLHLTGYPDMTLDEIKNFRQLHSKTPGHPEYGLASGIETTTGPLGQGIANGVGMAIAERALSAQFNRPNYDIVDHYTYVFMGDGCMMEGISHEACSLAGHLGLDKLVAFWDDNGISIDGKVAGWFSDDTQKRFEAYNWHVIADVDGHNPDEIKAAIEEAHRNCDKPTLICCRTVIGFGSPNKAGTSDVHGAPLGEDEVQLSKQGLGWEYPAFEIPEEIYQKFDARQKGKKLEQDWQALFAAYQAEYPELAKEFERRMQGQLPKEWQQVSKDYINSANDQGEGIASRKASLNCLNAYGPELPELMGGSADLTGSNLTLWSDCHAITNENYDGNYIYYGVREFGMAAITNGMALHGGFIPYSGTFLTFADYCKNALRLSALMKIRNIFVFTHDSIGLGEDGPTHQPIEQANMLRMTPHLDVWRPCDTVETAVAWQQAIERHDGPCALLFSRQGLPHQHRDATQITDIAKGGYVLLDCKGTPEVIVIATGSETQLAMAAAQQLNEQGKNIRVVSMPCADVFLRQDPAYQEKVLPKAVNKRIAIEAGNGDYWYRFVGLDGDVIAMTSFGESAPAKDVFKYFGFTVENVVNKINKIL